MRSSYEFQEACLSSVALSETVLDSRQLFDQLVGLAEELERLNRIGAAAVCGGMAAQVAWHNHAGFFTSPRLECLLLRLGMQTCSSISFPVVRKTDQRSVLHILTNATGVSGDTRFVWRWIQLDSDTRHSVALTRQIGTPIPTALQEAVTKNGGFLHVLNQPNLDLLRIASVLRRTAAGMHAVFVHTYPDDVVPTLAFAAAGTSPPVIMVDQSDHTFWLGTGIADLVLELRDAGKMLSQTARGIFSDRIELLPIPLTDFPAQRDMVAAKAKLGLAGKKVLLSIAVGFKYTPLLDPTWQDMILRILDQDTEVVCIVVGPKIADPVWQRASERGNGRLLIPGPTPDTKTYYEAADVYLDSYPFSSNTSLLEAGAHGVPLVGFYPHKTYAAVLCGGAVGLSNVMVVETEPTRYIKQVIELLKDKEARQVLGNKTRERLIELHGSVGWKESLENVYKRLNRFERKPRIVEGIAESGDNRLHNLLQQLYYLGGHYLSIPMMVERFVGSLAYSERVSLMRKLRELDSACSRDLLLPNWLRRALRVVRGQRY